MIPEVWLFVFAFITAASDDEAVVTILFVFPFTTAASDVEAPRIAALVFAFTADVIPEV